MDAFAVHLYVGGNNSVARKYSLIHETDLVAQND